VPASIQRRERSARAIAELLEQLARSTVNEAFAQGMQPAQWRGLRYVAQANEDARNIGAFAKFHLTTPSSASQTMGALSRKGLIVKRPGADARQRTLELTAKGRRLLAKDPIIAMSRTVLSLSESQMYLLAEILERLTRTAMKDAAAEVLVDDQGLIRPEA
jgi:DNA-binding MarR family transcriptional regulator